MLSKNVEQRASLFKEIKELYEDSIVSYNLSLEDSLDYLNTHSCIATLLEMMDANRGEIRIRLGCEFEKWFYETHDEITEQFWSEASKGLDWYIKQKERS